MPPPTTSTITPEQCKEIQRRAGMIHQLKFERARVLVDPQCRVGQPEWYDDKQVTLLLHPDDFAALQRWADQQVSR